ncbi:MAG: protein kinase [Myxococcales bacterium]|nr:protein kinase [Myxococcales bacterium]
MRDRSPANKGGIASFLVLRCPLCGLDLAPGTTQCPRDGVAIGDTDDPMVGVTLGGRYRVLARLARGGMASVFLAQHVLIGRRAAIKVLRRELCDDPVQRDRFLREARAVNRIDHENIVQIVDYGEADDGRMFLVMEYLPGESLHHRIGRGVLPPLRALDIAAQIAAGLARAHLSGVIHRDLKPDNILLLPPVEPGGRDRVKILDFGIAKLLDQPALTASDKIFGTPGYIAPEYASGAPIDARADLYSLGVVLYEMVTARLPFEAEYPADLLLKHMLDPPIPPRSVRPELHKAVEDLVLRLLVKNPDERFRDAFHLIEEIERVRQIVGGPSPEITAVRIPSLSLSAEPISPSDPSQAALAPPSLEQGKSVLGARAWNRYVDALRGALTERYRASIPEALVARLGAMEAQIATMRERLESIEQYKRELLALEARGREFRRNIGRAIDTLHRDRSVKERERDQIAQDREQIAAERSALLERVERGERDLAGEADAFLWRLAACDELLRDAVMQCEDIEYQSNELEAQLERLNEGLEHEQDALLTAMHAALEEVGRDDAALRSFVSQMQSTA